MYTQYKINQYNNNNMKLKIHMQTPSHQQLETKKVKKQKNIYKTVKYKVTIAFYCNL